jgi:2-keto-4-pentenoate hydratase
MQTEQVERAAALLVETRRSARPLRELPMDLRPVTQRDAYAIQDAVVACMGNVGGWKVGAKSPLAEPTCAPLLESLVLQSPHAFPSNALRLRGIEAEIAFLLARDLPPRSMAYTAAEVFAAIESVHPAIEIVESRFEDFRKTDPLSVLADSQSHGALVYGAGRADAIRIDPTHQEAVLYFDDAQVARTVDGNPAGDLGRLLAWLANHCAIRCEGLRAGQLVTTGSCTGMLFARARTRVVAELGALGRVEAGV